MFFYFLFSCIQGGTLRWCSLPCVQRKFTEFLWDVTTTPFSIGKREYRKSGVYFGAYFFHSKRGYHITKTTMVHFSWEFHNNNNLFSASTGRAKEGVFMPIYDAVINFQQTSKRKVYARLHSMRFASQWKQTWVVEVQSPYFPYFFSSWLNTCAISQPKWPNPDQNGWYYTYEKTTLKVRIPVKPSSNIWIKSIARIKR